jgi:plastocyanin
VHRVLLFLVLATLGACAGDSETKSAPAHAAVAVKDFAFGPNTVRVTAGGTVTWTNVDEFDHSVVIDDLRIDGPKFGPQTAPASYTHRFTTAGTYPYMCGVHNSMTGTVVVTT